MIKVVKISAIVLLISAIGLILDISNIRVPEGVDKIYHFVLFFVATLVFLLFYLKLFGRKWIYQIFAFVLFSSGIVAAFTEKIQEYSSIRTSEFIDWLANILGISLAVFMVYVFNLKSEKKNLE